MQNPHARSGWTALLLLLASLATFAGSSFAEDAKQPAKKDSRAQSKPKEVTFTTTVSPAKAKPGDTVTYKVTAKIDEPWHIYKYAKKQPDDGPVYTSFDFFDPAGLTKEGDWSSTTEPTKKKEPAFPDIPFLEYHEDEVTWTQKLKVPKDAKPGKLTLKCQAGYMICSDQNCSVPGRWTLPDATVTIERGPSSLRIKPNTERARVRLVSAITTEAAEGAKPRKADSRRAIPSEVKFSTRFVPAEAKAGETVKLEITAKPIADWHIFQYTKEWDGNGPKPTLIDAFDLGGLQPAGDWASTTTPIRKKDENFPEIDSIEFFETEVTWALPLVVPPGTEPGSKAARVQVGFQTCSHKSCSVPGQWTLPEATLTVAVGGSAVTAAAPTTPPSAATETKGEAQTPAKEEAPKVATVTPEAKVESVEENLSEVEKTSKSSLIAFLLYCAGGGLLALAMPCVWPMIPVTVNFFVKQGAKEGGKPTALAVTYCLSIIGIFTLIGVAFSVFFGASSLSKLANNPWLNTGIALAFFVFGLSLLGLFEIRLPNFLLNASAQGESRGGLVGVMFMATTLTITSFTCTFPVVGTLLGIAANGDYLYPIIGLATFATVVALPFFLLALAPGLMAKMPKSGDWMNSVKVVGGLVELAAAFKFVNTAEIGFHSVPEQVWIDEQAMLTVWVVISMICGVYLLGLFRTDHDHGEGKVGPGRMISGAFFLFVGLYLAPALFGKPPEGNFYNRLVVGLLPPQGTETKATSSVPEIAITQEKSKHGVVWGMSYDAAIAEARSEGKKVLVDFTGVNCSNCRLMERSVFPKTEVVDLMKGYVTVQLYTDFVPIATLSQDQRFKLGEDNLDREMKLTKGATTNPFYVIVDPSNGSEKVLATIGGYNDPATFVDFLNKGIKTKPAAGTASNQATGKVTEGPGRRS